jgi:hypothetical protein
MAALEGRAGAWLFHRLRTGLNQHPTGTPAPTRYQIDPAVKVARPGAIGTDRVPREISVSQATSWTASAVASRWVLIHSQGVWMNSTLPRRTNRSPASLLVSNQGLRGFLIQRSQLGTSWTSPQARQRTPRLRPRTKGKTLPATGSAAGTEGSLSGKRHRRPSRRGSTVWFTTAATTWLFRLGSNRQRGTHGPAAQSLVATLGCDGYFVLPMAGHVDLANFPC